MRTKPQKMCSSPFTTVFTVYCRHSKWWLRFAKIHQCRHLLRELTSNSNDFRPICTTQNHLGLGSPFRGPKNEVGPIQLSGGSKCGHLSVLYREREERAREFTKHIAGGRTCIDTESVNKIGKQSRLHLRLEDLRTGRDGAESQVVLVDCVIGAVLTFTWQILVHIIPLSVVTVRGRDIWNECVVPNSDAKYMLFRKMILNLTQMTLPVITSCGCSLA